MSSRISARGSSQGDADALGSDDLKNGFDDRSLADTGAAGDDHDLGGQGLGHGLVLALGQGHPQLALHPGDGLLRGDGRPRRGPGGKYPETFSDNLLCHLPMQTNSGTDLFLAVNIGATPVGSVRAFSNGSETADFRVVAGNVIGASNTRTAFIAEFWPTDPGQRTGAVIL